MPLHIVSLDPAGPVELGGQLTVHLQGLDEANPRVGAVAIKRIQIGGQLISSGQWSAYSFTDNLEIVIYQIPTDGLDMAEPLLEITYGGPNEETEILECPLQIVDDLAAVPAGNGALTVRQPVRLWSKGLSYIRGSGFPDQHNPGRLMLLVASKVITSSSIRIISSNLFQFRFPPNFVLLPPSTIKITRTLDNGQTDSVTVPCRVMD